ncbi:MAG: acyltransferase [Mucilaginibacter sp.]|nr:acyltransferase [Mucilaginibacter sp.]
MQAMRGFAATAVMIFHGTQIIQRETGYTYLHNIFMAGFLGVDIFFVLSGFIIFYTSKPESFDVASFLKRRFVRVYPIYWLVTIALIVMYLTAPSPGQEYKSNFTVILNSFTLFPQERYVLGVAWTLTYEIIFYLVFALTCSINIKCFYYTFSAWAVVILATYFLNIQSPVFALNALINPIILNFSFGCILAHLFKNHGAFSYWKWTAAAGTLLLAGTWLLYYIIVSNDKTAFTSLISRVYLFGIPSAIMIFGWLYFKGRVPNLLVTIGDASYSLYLVHGTVLSMLFKLIAKAHSTGWISNFFGSTLLFAVTIAISIAVYKFIEKPLLKQLNNLIKGRKTKSQIAADPVFPSVPEESAILLKPNT